MYIYHNVIILKNAFLCDILWCLTSYWIYYTAHWMDPMDILLYKEIWKQKIFRITRNTSMFLRTDTWTAVVSVAEPKLTV